MSTISGIPVNVRGRTITSWHSVLFAAVKTWWVKYLAHRVEREALIQLQRMSDRELEDIGLKRSQIRMAVRGELDRRPFPDQY